MHLCWRREKGFRCSFHSWDNYSHCDLNDPHCSPCISSTRQALSTALCQGIWKTPIMKPFWLIEKGPLKLHLLQRQLNYMSNCDNFPSIHSSFWKEKTEMLEGKLHRQCRVWNGCRKKWLRKCKTINKYVNLGLINKQSKRNKQKPGDKHTRTHM